MLFQLKKLPEIINLTRFLKSFWILYIDQIIVYNAFYSKLTFYIIKDRCQMHTLKVFRSPVWLLLHKLSSPHYGYIRKMRRGDRLPLTQGHAPLQVDSALVDPALRKSGLISNGCSGLIIYRYLCGLRQIRHYIKWKRII